MSRIKKSSSKKFLHELNVALFFLERFEKEMKKTFRKRIEKDQRNSIQKSKGGNPKIQNHEIFKKIREFFFRKSKKIFKKMPKKNKNK